MGWRRVASAGLAGGEVSLVAHGWPPRPFIYQDSAGDFPGGPVVKTEFSAGTDVPSLVGKLRSHPPHRPKKKLKKRKRAHRGEASAKEQTRAPPHLPLTQPEPAHFQTPRSPETQTPEDPWSPPSPSDLPTLTPPGSQRLPDPLAQVSQALTGWAAQMPGEASQDPLSFPRWGTGPQRRLPAQSSRRARPPPWPCDPFSGPARALW